MADLSGLLEPWVCHPAPPPVEPDSPYCAFELRREARRAAAAEELRRSPRVRTWPSGGPLRRVRVGYYGDRRFV